jgi:hypothetical protein
MRRVTILGAITAAFILLWALLAAMPWSASAAVLPLRYQVHATVLVHKTTALVHIQATALISKGRSHVLAMYVVLPGDTLSGIAQSRCGHANDWSGIYAASRKVVGGNPDLIVPGQRLTLRCVDPPTPAPKPVTKSDPAPRRSDEDDSAAQQPVHSNSDSAGSISGDSSHGRSAPSGGYSAPSGGMYGCGALESLWISAGGNSGAAVMAASIAMAESGGNPNAVSPTSDYGLWQINSSNMPGQSMLNPYANVREAISLSGNGSNWGPWTTYTSGAYSGKC